MTKLRKKELKRVKALGKRLAKKGYVVTGDIEKLTTQQLRKIHSGLQLARTGVYTMSESEAERRISERRERKLKRNANRRVTQAVKRQLPNTGNRNNVINIADGSDTGFSNDGLNIQRLNVYSGSEASTQIDILLGIAEYGKYYTGRKSDKSAVDLINSNGSDISDTIKEARRLYGDEVLVKAIEDSEFHSVQELGRFVEKLVLAVYDKSMFTGSGFMNSLGERSAGVP